jgi:hypothetical protein
MGVDIVSHGENFGIPGLANGARKRPGIVLPCGSAWYIPTRRRFRYWCEVGETRMFLLFLQVRRPLGQVI